MKIYKILIIDDDINTIKFIIDKLETNNKNYEFYHAPSGAEGVRVAEKFIPNLILTDWEMPEMSGIELIKRLKSAERTKDIPVIMVTGAMTTSQHLQTALDAGAVDFIRKPVDEIELQSRVRAVLQLADYYAELVALKNRELASTAMKILETNNFNTHIFNKLGEIETDISSQKKNILEHIKELRNTLSLKIKSEAWTQFETYFHNVNPDFQANLLADFPNLSPTDLRIAAFIRLNLNSKEIAAVTFTAVDSVKTARYRLRQKLNVDQTENLTGFLLKY